MTKYIFCCIIPIFLSICSSCQQASILSITRELNIKAAMILVKQSSNDDSMRWAVHILDSSLTIDKSNYLTYTLKSQIECTMGMYPDAIVDIDSVLSLRKGYLEIKTAKAFIYEKMGKPSLAIPIYAELLNDYNALIKSDSSNIDIIANRAFIILLLKGAMPARIEYDMICKRYPNEVKLTNLKETFYNFDRKKFMNDFCSR